MIGIMLKGGINSTANTYCDKRWEYNFLLFRLQRKAVHITTSVFVKVSKFRKQIMVSLILTNHEQNTQNTILSVFRSFFGRIRDFIICFLDLLTFSELEKTAVFHAWMLVKKENASNWWETSLTTSAQKSSKKVH